MSLCKYLVLLSSIALSLVADSDAIPFEPPELSKKSQPPKALDFIQSQQKENGSWNDDTILSSLCLAAYLSQGYTPKEKCYGVNIRRSIDYLLKADLEKESAEVRFFVLTILAETYAMTANYNIAEYLQSMSNNLTEDFTQNITFKNMLQLQAFKSYHSTGLEFEGQDKRLARNKKYLRTAQAQNNDAKSLYLLGKMKLEASYGLLISSDKFVEELFKKDIFASLSTREIAVKYYLLNYLAFLHGRDPWKKWSLAKKQYIDHLDDGSINITLKKGQVLSREDKLFQTAVVVLSEPPLRWWPREYFKPGKYNRVSEKMSKEETIDIF